jgi:tRNA pseudouridine-54 N-methylase
MERVIKCIRILAAAVVAVALCASEARAAEYMDAVLSGGNYQLSRDTIFSDKSIIAADRITITETLSLENRGRIDCDIFINSGQQLYLQNSGDLQGLIITSEDSRLFQVVKSSSDLTRLSVSGNGSFALLLQDTESLSLAEIMRIAAGTPTAAGADEIILDNAKIILGVLDAVGVPTEVAAPVLLRTRQIQPTLKLVGEVWIDIGDMPLGESPILSNVSGDGAVNIIARSLESLWAAAPVRRDGNIYLRLARETDYQKVLGADDQRGAFINSVRAANPENKTVRALDGALDMSGLRDVMSRSAMFNPIRLMRPVRVFDSFASAESFQEQNAEFSAAPVYIFSDGMNLYAGRATANLQVENWLLSASGYAGAFYSSDEYDEFSGDFYGANLRGIWSGESLWSSVLLGFTSARFQTDEIYSAGANPNGMEFYGNADIGAKFELGGIRLAPFVGVGASQASAAWQSESEIHLRAGGLVGITLGDIGSIRYDYELFAIAESNQTISAGVRIGAFSMADGAGGAFSYSVIRDESGLSHKLSAEVVFNF